MKATLITLSLALACLTTMSQSFSTIPKNKKNRNPMEDQSFKLYIRNTSVTSKYTPNYGAPTINIGFSDDSFEKGSKRSRYENPTLGDFLQGIPRGVKTVNAIKNDQPVDNTPTGWEDHAHGGGFFGWIQYYWNAVAKDRLLVSPGVSAGDYIYGSRYSINGGSKTKNGPYGYYAGGGPAVMATYLVSKKIWVDGYLNYDISFVKVKNEVPQDYPKPHFLTLGADLRSTSKLFGGIRMNRMIDRGANNDQSMRLDISAGIVF